MAERVYNKVSLADIERASGELLDSIGISLDNTKRGRRGFLNLLKEKDDQYRNRLTLTLMDRFETEDTIARQRAVQRMNGMTFEQLQQLQAKLSRKIADSFPKLPELDLPIPQLPTINLPSLQLPQVAMPPLPQMSGESLAAIARIMGIDIDADTYAPPVEESRAKADEAFADLDRLLGD